MHSLVIERCRIDATEAFAVLGDLASSRSYCDIESLLGANHVGGLKDRVLMFKLTKPALGSEWKLSVSPAQRHRTRSIQTTLPSPNSGDYTSRATSQVDIVASCLLITRTA